MKKIREYLIIYMFLIFSFIFNNVAFAATLVTSIPEVSVSTMTMSSEGTCTWGTPTAVSGYSIKRYDVQLLKRVTSAVVNGSYQYSYKTNGSVKYVSADENEYTFNISATGYYAFKIRCEDLEGNYGNWTYLFNINGQTETSYPGIEVTENDITAGGSSSGSGSGSSSYGPGVVQTYTNPYMYQYSVIGPNGEILYYYGGNQSNYGVYPNTNAYIQSGNQSVLGPGYNLGTNSSGQIYTPSTGVSNYPQVTAPNILGQGTTTYNSQTNPNYYSGNGSSSTYSPSQNTTNVSPQITQGLEVGWHVDNYGRFYYQGNGTVLKGTWYLIDGAYYRFGDTGYLYVNKWFQDTTTGSWYYLGGDGKMLTGWQSINGTWYYFRPELGQGYGTMYANTSLQINDQKWGSGYYAFDSNGAMVKNAWYGGSYYGNDGKKTN